MDVEVESIVSAVLLNGPSVTAAKQKTQVQLSKCVTVHRLSAGWSRSNLLNRD